MLQISIFQWISIFGDFQALYELPTRTLTSLAVLDRFLHRCACGRRCCGSISLTDGQNSFQWGGLKASHPGITESIPVRGTPKSSEGDMSFRPPVKYHPAYSTPWIADYYRTLMTPTLSTRSPSSYQHRRCVNDCRRRSLNATQPRDNAGNAHNSALKTSLIY